jgi:hypothetical protein
MSWRAEKPSTAAVAGVLKLLAPEDAPPSLRQLVELIATEIATELATPIKPGNRAKVRTKLQQFSRALRLAQALCRDPDLGPYLHGPRGIFAAPNLLEPSLSLELLEHSVQNAEWWHARIPVGRGRYTPADASGEPFAKALCVSAAAKLLMRITGQWPGKENGFLFDLCNALWKAAWRAPMDAYGWDRTIALVLDMDEPVETQAELDSATIVLRARLRVGELFRQAGQGRQNSEK